MNTAINILIVDDDVEICELLSQFLNKHNFHVTVAHEGIAMFKALEQQKFDLIILDMMLPGDDGITLCRKLQTQYDIPILILSAVGEDTDRIIGLEVGADDYLAKPFNPRELLARIKAILRRSQNQPHTTEEIEIVPEHHFYKFNDWKLNRSTRQLFSPQDIETVISAGEYDMLIAFLEHPQQVLSRDRLLDLTRSRDAGPFDRSVDMQVSRLRQKIETNPKKPLLIKTVRGGGYIFTVSVKQC